MKFFAIVVALAASAVVHPALGQGHFNRNGVRSLIRHESIEMVDGTTIRQLQSGSETKSYSSAVDFPQTISDPFLCAVDVNATITSPGTTISIIAITDDLSILDLNVGIDANHTLPSDLAITLEGPDGTQVILVNGNCGGGRDDGSSSGNIIQTFDDEATATFPVNETVLCVNGDDPFRPLEALSAFDGKSTFGAWTLLVEDFFCNDVGIVNAWSLSVEVPAVSSPSTPSLSASPSPSESPPVMSPSSSQSPLPTPTPVESSTSFPTSTTSFTIPKGDYARACNNPEDVLYNGRGDVTCECLFMQENPYVDCVVGSPECGGDQYCVEINQYWFFDVKGDGRLTSLQTCYLCTQNSVCDFEDVCVSVRFDDFINPASCFLYSLDDSNKDNCNNCALCPISDSIVGVIYDCPTLNETSGDRCQAGAPDFTKTPFNLDATPPPFTSPAGDSPRSSPVSVPAVPTPTPVVTTAPNIFLGSSSTSGADRLCPLVGLFVLSALVCLG